MEKKFSTYEQLIQRLKEKGLNVQDEKKAIEVLNETGYYSLVCGYKQLLKTPDGKEYRQDASFEDMVALYSFDQTLRSLFLKYLIQFEKALKAQISYAFCQNFGIDQKEYLNIANYQYSPHDVVRVQKLIQVLSDLATKQTNFQYINHYQTKYHNVPLWVLINAVTFGSLSVMFHYLPQKLQSQISKHYPIYANELESILEVLTKFRNVCAHGERLFSYSTRTEIADFALHSKMGIIRNNGVLVSGKRDLFAVVISLRYVLSNEQFKVFKKELSQLIAAFTAECDLISEEELLTQMGFPSNWKMISRHKL
jgi:abortive infection bacteriophage resistance protein